MTHVRKLNTLARFVLLISSALFVSACEEKQNLVLDGTWASSCQPIGPEKFANLYVIQTVNFLPERGFANSAEYYKNPDCLDGKLYSIQKSGSFTAPGMGAGVPTSGEIDVDWNIKGFEYTFFDADILAKYNADIDKSSGLCNSRFVLGAAKNLLSLDCQSSHKADQQIYVYDRILAKDGHFYRKILSPIDQYFDGSSPEKRVKLIGKAYISEFNRQDIDQQKGKDI